MDAAPPQFTAAAGLQWLARRLLLPAIIAALAIDAIVLLVVTGGSVARPVPSLVEFLNAALVVFGFTAALVTLGLLLVGLPAGVLVARLRHGLAASFLMLVGVGAAGGCAISMRILPRLMGYTAEAIATGAGFGALTAAIWTWLNRALFRSR